MPQDSSLRSPPAPAAATSTYLPSAPSILLDLVRLLAAFTVAVGHLSQNYFTTGWPPVLMQDAQAAVAVFFVLSGFMIRYITRVKLGSLRQYAADRITRIYSVALPVLALTLLFDLISAHLHPAFYALNFSELGRRGLSPADAAHALNAGFWFRSLFRVALSLAMLAQSWFRDSSPLSNSPFWSICYECVFYALFGITLYLRGSKRILAWAVVFLLIGPTVLLMYPLWLLGCASYDAYDEGTLRSGTLLRLLGLSALSIAAVHGIPSIIRRTGASWFYVGRAVPSMDIVAIATAFLLPLFCLAIRNVGVAERNPLVRFIRKAAAATFPLYLIHFPLFVLLAAALPYSRNTLSAKLAILILAFLLSLLLSGPCDRLKDAFRRRLMPGKRNSAGNPAPPA